VHEWKHEQMDAEHGPTSVRAEMTAMQPLIDTLLQYYADFDLEVTRVEYGILESEPDKVAFLGPEGYFRFVVLPESGALAIDYGTPPEVPDGDPAALGIEFADAGTLEEHGYSALGQWMLDLHANLFLGTMGTIFTGIVGILLLLSTLTGLYIYGPFMKAMAFGAIRSGSRLNQSMADLHKVVGMVSLVFNGMMALTGIGLTLGIIAIQVYLLQELKVFEATGGAIAVADPLPSVDRVAALGRETLPDTHIYRIDYPGGIQGEKSFAVYAQKEADDRGLIPIVAAITAETAPRANRFAMPLWIKAIVLGIPIHVASFGGNIVRFIYIFFALSSGILSVSGFVMYGVKWYRNAKTRRRPVRSAVPAAPGVPVPSPREVVAHADD
jgi:uncharacterized iron-regulated membrane protein